MEWFPNGNEGLFSLHRLLYEGTCDLLLTRTHGLISSQGKVDILSKFLCGARRKSSFPCYGKKIPKRDFSLRGEAVKSSWRDFLLVGSVCVLLGVSLMLVLSRMGNEVQEDMEFKCQDLQGELVFYECYHAGDWFLAENDRCVNKVAGYVCKLPDGSEVEFTYDLLAREVKP